MSLFKGEPFCYRAIMFNSLVRIMGVHSKRANQILDSDNPVSLTEWRKMFENSSSVHLAGATRTYLDRLAEDPRFSVYAVLGSRHCPLSYFSVRYF